MPRCTRLPDRESGKPENNSAGRLGNRRNRIEGMTDLAGLNIKYLPGVGPKRAELLNKELEIFTYLDLLHYYPYKYIDRSKTYKINEIDGSMPYIQLRGKIVSYTTHGEGARRRLTAL